jgi:hypothetical protein
MIPFRYFGNLFLPVMAGTALFLGGCANETLTSTWTNPEYDGVPMTKTAVVVLAKDENIRRFAENQMVQKLPQGTFGVAGYTLFDKPEQDKDKVRDILVMDGFDSVLVSRLVSMDKTQSYVPPQTFVVPPQTYAQPYGGARPNYGSFRGYYGQAYGTVYTAPGYTVVDTAVVVETLLYRLPDGMLVWTGTTKTLNPQSKAELVQGITLLVGNELRKKRLFGSTGK